MGIHAMKGVQQERLLNETLVPDETTIDKSESMQSIDRLLKESLNEETYSDNNIEVGDDFEEKQEEKTLTDIFSYSQTNFQEDDITELEIFQSNQIGIYLPETFKERKCMSCRRRFMFEDSYNEHIKDCIQIKLVAFIREVCQLLYLKENRSISSHEFIRRVIFGIKKTVQILVEYDEGVKKEVEKMNQTADPNQTSIPTSTPLHKKKDATVELMTPEAFLAKINVKDVFSNSASESENVTNTSYTSSPITTICAKCPDCRLDFDTISDLEGHNRKFHNQSYPIQASTSLYNKSFLRKPPRINSYAYHRFPSLDTEESSNPEVNNFLFVSKDTKPNNTRNLNISHHYNTHNKSFKVIDNKIDIIKNNLLCDNNGTETTSDAEGCDNNKKLVKCSKCNDKFLTISHLDMHMAKKHTRSPSNQSNSSATEFQGNEIRPNNSWKPHSYRRQI